MMNWFFHSSLKHEQQQKHCKQQQQILDLPCQQQQQLDGEYIPFRSPGHFGGKFHQFRGQPGKNYMVNYLVI